VLLHHRLNRLKKIMHCISHKASRRDFECFSHKEMINVCAGSVAQVVEHLASTKG
jgi:hypothetical protein